MSLDSHRLRTHPASEHFVFSKLQYLREIHLWPLRARLDPHAWINNFTDVERPYAINILNVFLYLSDDLVDAMFRATVHSLCSEVTANATSFSEARSIWQMFLSALRVTYVQGEQPRPTDSGLLFARKARQLLGISDEHIIDPRDALANLTLGLSEPVMFVDDFVGSGNQMIATWTRRHQMDVNEVVSFLDTTHESYVVYAPLVTTQLGLEAIVTTCPGLKIRPAHCVDDRYSLISPTSVLWPDKLRSTASEVLYNASYRAGIVENCEFGWKGFRDLGLAIAFQHSVPDATLPLIFWEDGDWRPLIRRS